jgi:hypothetical protein
VDFLRQSAIREHYGNTNRDNLAKPSKCHASITDERVL